MSTNQLIVMMGVPGVGKSTYIKQHYPHAKIFNSDAYRQQELGDINNQTDNAGIFEKLHHDLKTYLKENQDVTAVFDAQNIKRKQRRGVYDMYKKFAHVHIVFVYQPLATILEQNAKRDRQVPDYIITRNYKAQQPPKENVDCDDFEVIVDNDLFGNVNVQYVQTVADFKDVRPDLWQEIALNFTSHNSVYHQESVDEHIALTIKNADQQLRSEHFHEIAAFHDLGKGLCKHPHPDGIHSQFSGHENVGAIYAMVYDSLNKITCLGDYTTAEIIYNHMRAHKGFSPKTIRLEKLSTDVLIDTQVFKNIDNASRR